MARRSSAPRRPVDHAALQAEERELILAQCEAEGLVMDVCRAMSFRELRDMWSDYQSDQAMMNGEAI